MRRINSVESVYLSSHLIIMQVECCASVVSFLWSVNEASRLLFSIFGVIAASAPFPLTVSLHLFSCFTASTSGDSIARALKSDLVCNGGAADGVKKSGFPSGCKHLKITVDHYMFLGKCPPSPPLNQHFALIEK